MQLYVLPAQSPHAKNISLYNDSFLLWESIWLETLRELDGLEVLHSDAFTRQDFFVVATDGDQPVALCCFKKIDLQVMSHRKDSWLAPWPPVLLDQVARTHPLALIPSWLTVHPDYRKSSGYVGPNLGLIMSEMISLVCLHTKMDVAFGTPRKDRSVNKLVEQAGAVCLMENVLHHGVWIDLVAFYPERLRQISFTADAQTLWNQRIDFTHNKQQKEIRHESSI